MSSQDDVSIEKDKNEREGIRLTPKEYQILADLFKNTSDTTSHVQVNQVGVAYQSIIGNVPSTSA